MKIKINRIEFLKAVDVLSAVAKENKIRPVISGIKVDVTDKIVLQATDLENTLEIELSGEIENRGKCVIIHEEIKEYIKEIESEKVIFEIENNMLNIISENIEFGSSIYDVEEYPMIKLRNEGKSITIEAEKFVNGITKVKFAMPLKSDNLAIFGIRIIANENGITFAATDSYRMIMNTEELEVENNMQFTLSRFAIDSILKFLKDNKGLIDVRIDANNCSIITEKNRFSTRIIDVAYPDIFSFEDGFQHEISIESDSKLFEKPLKRIRSITKSNLEMKNSAVFNFSEKQLEINAVSEKSKAKEKIEEIKTKKLKINMNVEYILNFLEHTDNFTMQLSVSNNAVKMFAGNYRYYFMPLALKD
jgi:DNA polymerase III subunit beta